MEKERVDILAQLLTNMKDALNELESALKKKNADGINSAKRKILSLQIQIDKSI